MDIHKLLYSKGVNKVKLDAAEPQITFYSAGTSQASRRICNPWTGQSSWGAAHWTTRLWENLASKGHSK